MAIRNYLLFIDEKPIDKDLQDYFAPFNIDITCQKKIQPITNEQCLPLAIIIYWPILKNHLPKLSDLYQVYPVPLIVINDRLDEEACITVLESGADDFLIKPLYPRELHARICAISRRVTQDLRASKPKIECLVFANFRLYPASRQIFDATNKELLLTAGEYDLLYVFVQKPLCVLNREVLIQSSKHNHHNPYDRRIDVQISRLRQKIEDDPQKPQLIRTIRNEGYMFMPPVS
ncbi:MAG: winged helix-turn-helix domain-containing protein, partial [Legionellales bacterium]